MGDTLSVAANNAIVQQIAVIAQGVLLIIGAILALFGKKVIKQ